MEQPVRKPLFDTFDWLIGIGAVPFQSPPIYVAAALLVIARHWWRPARGFFVIVRDVFGVRQVTPLWCKVFPGLERYLHMSSEPQNHLGSPGSSTGSGNAVLPQQHQVEPEEPAVFDYVLNYLARHNLTDEQAIDLFTVARRESGYLLSANKIRETVGGNEAAVKARVASRRPKPQEPPRTMGKATRPDDGW